jgi:hypothetical protein
VDVVHRFLSEPAVEKGAARGEAGWEVEEELFVQPVPGWHDGGYACRIRLEEQRNI